VSTDSVTGELITPVPLVPSSSAVVRELVDNLAAFFDDGSAVLQHMVARLPLLFDVGRAYIARISPDGARFSVTQASTGENAGDLLGYTQSVARLPAYVRGALRQGVQGSIQDTLTFPFTPQQRRMIWYERVGASVVTPVPSAGSVAGALIVDVFGESRKWDSATLEALRSLAEAIGARFALSQFGDHLTSRGDADDDPHGEEAGATESLATVTARRTDEAMRMNVLANLAELLGSSNNPVETSTKIAETLQDLPFVGTARHLAADHPSGLPREALASERLIVRRHQGETLVVLPLILEGERFGAIEVLLAHGGQLDAGEEQFLRTVAVFASQTFASALRRQRPRNEALSDPMTGLPNFRAVNESLIEGVHAARSGNRPLAVWLLDIEGLDEIKRANGYAVGDDCVGFVGHTLAASIAPRGLVGRVRGGSFMCVFPGTTAEEAAVAARILVERVEKRSPGHLPAIGLTIGVAAFPAHAGSADELARYARLALFAAKREGRNHVVTARAGDELWVRDARAAFVRIVTEQEVPAASRGRQSPS
jgi:diguanylate cyclase (GGDEF)-like protein